MDSKGCVDIKGVGIMIMGITLCVKDRTKFTEDAITTRDIVLLIRSMIGPRMKASVAVMIVDTRMWPVTRLNVRVATARDPWGEMLMLTSVSTTVVIA